MHEVIDAMFERNVSTSLSSRETLRWDFKIFETEVSLYESKLFASLIKNFCHLINIYQQNISLKAWFFPY